MKRFLFLEIFTFCLVLIIINHKLYNFLSHIFSQWGTFAQWPYNKATVYINQEILKIALISNAH
jgi:hypothetical protein